MYTYRNQFIVSLNKATHTNVASDGMLTIRNENPVAGQSEINFTFYNGTTDVLKANIRADYNGVLNLGAKGYIADYIDPTYGPDVYGDGTHFPAIIFYRDTDKVESNRPFRVSSNSSSGFATGKGLKLNYSSTLDYAFITSRDDTGNAWKPIIYEAISHKWAVSGFDRMLLQAGLNIGGTTDPGAGNLTLSTSSGGGLRIKSSTQGAIVFANDDSSVFAKIEYDDSTGNFNINNPRGFPVRILTNNTLRVFVPSGGGMTLSGTTSAGDGNLMLAGGAAKGGVLWFGNDGSRYLQYNTGFAAYDFGNAGVYANGVLLTSSATKKQNIRDLAQSSAGKSLRPRKYQFKDQPALDRTGFVAEEVQEVFPDAVVTGPGTLAIDPMALIAKHELEIQALRADLGAMRASSPWWYAPADPVTPPLKR
jgi:hypothetical protein